MKYLTESEAEVKKVLDICVEAGAVDIMDTMLKQIRTTFRLHRLYVNTARFMRLRMEMQCATR